MMKNSIIAMFVIVIFQLGCSDKNNKCIWVDYNTPVDLNFMLGKNISFNSTSNEIKRRYHQSFTFRNEPYEDSLDKNSEFTLLAKSNEEYRRIDVKKIMNTFLRITY